MIEDPNEIRLRIAKEYVSKVRSELPEFRSAYVFGSTARYEAQETKGHKSDIDIMVVLKIPEERNPMQSYSDDLKSIAKEFENRHGIEVSPIWVKEEFKKKSPLAVIATREGILIDSI